MPPNDGAVDRIIRVLAGVASIAATLFGTIGVWGLIAVIPLATGVFRICPAYMLFGWSTCPAKTALAKL